MNMQNCHRAIFGLKHYHIDAAAPDAAQMDDRSPPPERLQTEAQPTAARRYGASIGLPQISLSMRILDLSVVAGLGVLIWFIYVYPRSGLDVSQYGTAVALALLLTGNALHFSGVYRPEALKRPAFQLGRVALAVTAVFFALVTIAFLTKTSASFSRVWATGWFVGNLGGLGLSRLILTSKLESWRRAGRLNRATIVAGAGEQGQRLVEALYRDPENDAEILAIFDDRTDRVPRQICGIPVVGRFDQMVRFCRERHVDQVLIALPASAEARLLEIAEMLKPLPVDVRLCLDLIGFNYRFRSFSHVAGVPFLNLYDRPISQADSVIKWLEDKGLAFIALLLLGPPMVLIALAIKLESRGPILFRQPRQGFNNQIIEVWKFRTMYHELADVDGARSVTRGDPRVTRIGQFLRRFSLDELPQILNVLAGDMSLVGPRPHALSTRAEGRPLQEVVAEYASRHRVKPGITGWAQINGWRGETDTEEKVKGRVEADLYYIENWSIWLDILILARTLGAVASARNAY